MSIQAFAPRVLDPESLGQFPRMQTRVDSAARLGMIYGFVERSRASGAWKFGSRSDDTDAAALPRSRLLADHDLDVLVEGGQQIHQTFH